MTRYLILTLAAALTIAMALAGVQSWRIDRLKADLIEANAELKQLRDFKTAAKDDAQIQADQCLARVKAAAETARRIETIIERPIHVDPQGCAVRSVIDSDELRDALQPPAPAIALH